MIIDRLTNNSFYLINISKGSYYEKNIIINFNIHAISFL